MLSLACPCIACRYLRIICQKKPACKRGGQCPRARRISGQRAWRRRRADGQPDRRRDDSRRRTPPAWPGPPWRPSALRRAAQRPAGPATAMRTERRAGAAATRRRPAATSSPEKRRSGGRRAATAAAVPAARGHGCCGDAEGYDRRGRVDAVRCPPAPCSGWANALAGSLSVVVTLVAVGVSRHLHRADDCGVASAAVRIVGQVHGVIEGMDAGHIGLHAQTEQMDRTTRHGNGGRAMREGRERVEGPTPSRLSASQWTATARAMRKTAQSPCGRRAANRFAAQPAAQEARTARRRR